MGKINYFLNYFKLYILFKKRIESNRFKKFKCDINEFTKIRERYSFYNVKIGFGTYVSSNAKISNTNIGKFCSLGPNILCGWGIHPTNGISTNPAFYSTAKQNGFTYSKTNKIEERKNIFIGNDVYIGANVTILDGIVINDGAIIGAGAVVSKNIPAYAIAVGNPIQIIKYRYNDEIIKELIDLKWWDQNDEVYNKVEEYFFDIDKFISFMRNKQNNI
jgi:acetyltransferase-like isoleucine patch superfamily enzyme